MNIHGGSCGPTNYSTYLYDNHNHFCHFEIPTCTNNVSSTSEIYLNKSDFKDIPHLFVSFTVPHKDLTTSHFLFCIILTAYEMS